MPKSRISLKHPHTIAGVHTHTHRQPRGIFILSSPIPEADTSARRVPATAPPTWGAAHCARGRRDWESRCSTPWFSTLTFHLKVNLSVCSVCLKKSSKPPCQGVPHTFLQTRLQRSYAVFRGDIEGGGEVGWPLPTPEGCLGALCSSGVGTQYL